MNNVISMQPIPNNFSGNQYNKPMTKKGSQIFILVFSCLLIGVSLYLIIQKPWKHASTTISPVSTDSSSPTTTSTKEIVTPTSTTLSTPSTVSMSSYPSSAPFTTSSTPSTTTSTPSTSSTTFTTDTPSTSSTTDISSTPSTSSTTDISSTPSTTSSTDTPSTTSSTDTPSTVSTTSTTKTGNKGSISCLNFCSNYGGLYGSGATYSSCVSATDSSNNSISCTATSSYSLTCACSGPTDPIQYLGSGCIIQQLPTTDGSNTYGLYFPTSISLLHITGFPSTTFTGNWTIEFFVFIPSTTASSSTYAGALLTSSNSSSLPITAYPTQSGKSGSGNWGKYNMDISIAISSNAGKISGTVSTVQSAGGFSGSEAPYTTGSWTSIVMVYNSATTTQNYSIWVTPKGGTSFNTLYINEDATNLGAVGYMSTIALGSITSNAPEGVYISNLRISNIARYTWQSTGSVPSPDVVWPGSSYTADSNTVYFNSFNVPSTTTTMGYLLSQIVQSS